MMANGSQGTALQMHLIMGDPTASEIKTAPFTLKTFYHKYQYLSKHFC